MFKNNENFVIDETNDFLRDFFNSNKRLKLFSNFGKFNFEHNSKEMEIEIPKKKFVSKVTNVNLKKDKSNNHKNIF
jgi:hypothetical protein